jgi:hypothetical protein
LAKSSPMYWPLRHGAGHHLTSSARVAAPPHGVVHLVVPLAHAGEFGPAAAGLQVVMHWQFRSINRGSGALLKRYAVDRTRAYG